MRICVAMATCGLFVLAGCSGGAFNGSSGAGSQAAGSTAGAKIAGVVHGGQQPIVGAHVYLFAAVSGASGAGQAAYGGAGIAASTSNASVSLLTSGSGTTLDTSGGATNGDYYVTTDGSGNFSISGDYTCTAGTQVYLYALGGNPGSGTNSAAGLMAALGNCPAAGNFLAATPYVVVNEVSTVAAAYAMAGFATDAVHVGSSGTTLALTGIGNAFANSATLETLGTGVALAATPAGNGTVPQAEINTLANILASCVNSNGAVTGPTNATACYTLFTSALSGGGTGTQPTDTATAAVNIAHNPGVNVAALYGLAGANPPFGTALTSQPNDFSISLVFAPSVLNVPGAIAIDAVGDAWISNFDGNNVAELSPTGAVLSGANGFAKGSATEPDGLAIDASGNVWISCENGPLSYEISKTGSFVEQPHGYSVGGSAIAVAVDGAGNAWFAENNLLPEYSSSGSTVSGTTPYENNGLQSAAGPSIAIDGSGSAWVANKTGTVTVVSGSGSYSEYMGPGCCSSADGIAIDGLGNAWIADEVSGLVYEFSHSGSLLSGSGYKGGGIAAPVAVSVDGAGKVWVVGGTVTELSSTGAVLSGSTGYKNSDFYDPSSMAIDGSGDLWVANVGYPVEADSVVEWIGVATPVITPIAAGLPATPTANGTSNLGTRP